MTTCKRPEGHYDEDGRPTNREAQQPIGPVQGEDTWLSGEDEHEPLREEAAERARRAVEPGRPRE
jgi:hypothetical protein